MLSIIPSLLLGQTCDCKAEIDFLITSYREDYSGFQDFSKAHPEYEERFREIAAQAAKVEKVKACHAVIETFIDYLNNGHVGFGVMEENPKYKQLAKQNRKKRNKDVNPTLSWLNSQTALLSVKTSNLAYKSELDQLLSEGEAKMKNTTHLIIDLRGNSGGGDDMYSAILPLIYTDPIVVHGASLWASENNIKLFESLVNNSDLPEETRAQVQSIVDKAKQYPNTFVLMGDVAIDTVTLDIEQAFPKRVSIIVDKECASATEEFLLKAKQSKKTTIYGYENTGGALDYSNLNVVFTPSGYWYATVPTTRTTRLPDNPVDPDGIKPDVVLEKNVKDIIAWLLNK